VHQAVIELYPIKVWQFSAHLFSRTRDFADDFAKPFSFDEIILMDIYPAVNYRWKGTSEWLLDKIDNKNKKIVLKEDLINPF
jgi:UDP-N-acetylmuramate--alanine ligase